MVNPSNTTKHITIGCFAAISRKRLSNSGSRSTDVWRAAAAFPQNCDEDRYDGG